MSNPDEPSRAPRWHTLALVALILAVAATGSWLSSQGASVVAPPSSGSRITNTYLPMILVAWGLVFYVSRVGRRENELWKLIGRRWTTVSRAAVDIALAVAAALAILGVENAGRSAAVSGVLPRTLGEKLVWVVVAVSVGFSEEVVYRGYLQRALGGVVVGVIGQAVLFGIAHAEQGPPAMLRIGVYGLAFGALAHYRKSLLPGILCHLALDVTSGFLG